MSGSDILVVGGGIAGLAAALRLSETSDAPAITVLEGAERFGGHLGTDRVDGWLLERGPDLFLGGKPGAYELCERLGLAPRLHGTTSGLGSLILSRGRLRRVPEGLTGMVPSRAAPFVRSGVLTLADKARVALDLVIPPRRDGGDETVERFVVRRLGRGMYDRLVEPLLSGIYAGDGRTLSVLATFPHLRESERRHGGMLRAMLAARGGGGPRRGFLTLPGGLQEMVDAITDRLRGRGATLRAGARVVALERTGEGWRARLGDGGSVEARGVLLATPAHAAAALLDPHLPDASMALREIPHASTITVALGYRRAEVPHALDATGYVVPRVEGRTALACTWVSSKFAGRAPEDHALFRVFLGGAARPPVAGLSDAEVGSLAREELREILGVTAAPTLVRVERHQDAMPQYTLGHRERVARVESAVATLPGLAIAGNWLRGVGIPDCIVSGEGAAERLLAGVGR